MIAIGLSPNTQRDDVITALSVLLTPWRWFRGSAVKALEDWFKRYFRAQFAISFDSGRSCEYAILKAIGIGTGDEVLIQPFTCVAVPNSILWNGGTPVYIDVDETGNIDVTELEKKITPKSRAIIVQHTFGISANIEAIQALARKHKLILIEDCAHALGATRTGKKLGTYGDISFFSFGRDKVVSCVFGGMVLTNNKKYAQVIRNFQRNLPFPLIGWVFAQLFHPVAFTFILPLYNVFSIGKALLVFLQKIGLLGTPVDITEKRGQRPSFYPRKLPNAQAIVALNQLKKLEACNKKRQKIAHLYTKALHNLPITLPPYSDGDIFLRYNIQTSVAPEIYVFFRKKGILLGRWYSHIIDPVGVELTKVGYQMGSFPKAESMARKSLNLPTYPRMQISDATKIVQVLRQYYGKS